MEWTDTKVKMSALENNIFIAFTPDYHKTVESWNSLGWEGTLKII